MELMITGRFMHSNKNPDPDGQVIQNKIYFSEALVHRNVAPTF